MRLTKVSARYDSVMALYKEQGIVLRTMSLGEADRIVTLLTQGSGKVRAVAKGVRKTKSRFGARVEPFTHVDLVLYRGRELDIVTQAEIITSFREIREDYARFAAGEVMLEATERVAQERERGIRLFMLVLGALRALADPAADPAPVADAFLIRLVSLAGFRPALGACAACGRPGPHGRFSIAQGGSVCERCRTGGAARVEEATVSYLSALLDGGWDGISAPGVPAVATPAADAPAVALPAGTPPAGAASASEEARRDGSGLVRAYVEYHLDRPLRAWAHVPR